MRRGLRGVVPPAGEPPSTVGAGLPSKGRENGRVVNSSWWVARKGHAAADKAASVGMNRNSCSMKTRSGVI